MNTIHAMAAKAPAAPRAILAVVLGYTLGLGLSVLLNSI